MNEPKKLEFVPCLYGKQQVRSLSPSQMDFMLENGWFRNGDYATTGICSVIERELQPGVMLRINLKQFKFKKRHRRLLRQNHSIFRVDVKPYKVSEEKEQLWQIYKNQVHGWQTVPIFDHHIFRGRTGVDFNTWEVQIFQEERLIAFSVFDMGGTSIAALEAAYHPAFSKYSLGYFSMLIEIDLALEGGLSYYYPGLLPKNNSMFNYKLRPGNIEFFRLSESRWLPWVEQNEKDWLYDSTLAKLGMMSLYLQQANWTCAYSFHFLPHQPETQVSPNEFNICLLATLNNSDDLAQYMLIGWNGLEEKYYVFDASVILQSKLSSQELERKWLLIRSIWQSSLIGVASWPSDVLKLMNDYKASS